MGTITPATVKAQNVAFFGVAITQKSNNVDPYMVRVHLNVNSGALIQYTVDNGTNWLDLVTVLTANLMAVIKVPVPPAGQFNLRCKDAAGTTINRCDVDELLAGT